MDLYNQSPVFVAVIDDEKDLAYLFKDALSQIDGLEVFAFSDPLLALEHFKANHQNYRVVVSDFRMPTMTGIEVLNKMKKINQSVIRILMSAFEIQDSLFEECDCVDKFLRKPISTVKLIDEVGILINPIQVPHKKLNDT